MGQAHDLLARVAEALLYAVPVGAVGVGDGNFSVPDGDDVGAAFGGDGKFLIHMQIYDPDGFSLTDDLRLRGGRRIGRE